jgi:chromatin structure-remodeling complex subunit SFH1
MSTLVQAATSTYASRLKTGNTPLIIPSSSVLARNRALVTGTPLATSTPLPSARPKRFRSSSLRDEDEDDEDEDEEDFLDVESDEEAAKKEKEDEEWEEHGGFVTGPPAEVLIQRRNAPVTKHIYRYALLDRVLTQTGPRNGECGVGGGDNDSYTLRHRPRLLQNKRCIHVEHERYVRTAPRLTTEELVTPDQFAQIMCLDLDIPPQIYAPQISSAIRTQIEEYAPVAEIQIPEETELRVKVNIQLHLAKHLLRDQFEWNLAANDLTPEAFALLVCQDLSLSSGMKNPQLLLIPDFPPSLAHAIHESLLHLKKDALEGNLPMFVNEAAYGLDAGIRLDTESLCASWAPTLELLSRDEIERREGDRERQIRRLKRDTARFGGLGNFTVMEEEILASGRRRLKRKRSNSPMGRGTPRGPNSRADSPAVVDVSVSRATTLTDKYVSI